MKNICLDIGGTTIKCAVVEGGNIIKYVKIPTHAKEGKDAIINSIYHGIELMLPYADKLGGIGLGSAGDIDPIEGKVIFATGNLPNFTGLELARIVSSKFDRKTTLINDAHSGGLAEYTYGAGKGKRSMVMITLGTGLGSTYICDGNQMLGDNFRGLRLGHLVAYPGGRECNCGKIGCVEQYVSATGLIRNAIEFGVDKRESGEIFRLAQNGNPAAKQATNKFILDLAIFSRNLLAIFDPSCVIIGGGLVELKEYWWAELMTELQDVKDIILPAQLGNSAGVIGANIYLDKTTRILLEC